MARTILVFFERLLIAVVSILIAAIVVSLFLRALRGPEVIVTTVGADGAVQTEDQVTTTEFVPITFPAGPCAEEVPGAEPGLDVLTVYYTSSIQGHDGYHMGAVVWDPAR